jgi:prefoldin subunit 5
MAEHTDNRLIYAILKSIQRRLAALEGMSAEMRTMRALLRTHATRHDTAFLEDRLAELESTLEHLERRLTKERW